MNTPDQQITPDFNDQVTCNNPECVEGRITMWIRNEDGDMVPDKEDCPDCDGTGYEN